MGWKRANFYIRHAPNNGQCPKRLSTATIKRHNSRKTNNSSLVTKVKSPFCITNPRIIKTI